MHYLLKTIFRLLHYYSLVDFNPTTGNAYYFYNRADTKYISLRQKEVMTQTLFTNVRCSINFDDAAANDRKSLIVSSYHLVEVVHESGSHEVGVTAFSG